MAASKKYAGLPDLDVAPEVYETPELADDVSTAQTGTVRTISPSPSEDDGQPGLDRHPVDREEARRRFGGSRLDAKDVDFSDSIAGPRRSYRTRTTRRRRVINDKGVEENVYMSDSEDETLSRKLARLKREAEEVRLELQRLEQEKDADGEFKDSVEQQQADQEEGADLDGVEDLSRVLDGLSAKAGLKGLGTAEEQFISKLNSSSRQRQRHRTKDEASEGNDNLVLTSEEAPSALSAVAAFSDRLTALEAALGVPTTSADTQTTSILPTLDNLSIQINTLTHALNLPAGTASSSSNTAPSAPHTTPLLDSVSSKLKTLITESKNLEQGRKSALEALARLHDTRMHQLVSATVHTNTRPRRGMSNASGAANSKEVAELSRPDDESLQITSKMFLEEQSAKVTALYQLLPSIQNLQPLLPVVLERLRALNVIHAGAAEARNNLDEVEKRQGEMSVEIKQWRDAVEVVESGMKELEETMKGNVKVVGDMVGNLEGRIGRFSQGK